MALWSSVSAIALLAGTAVGSFPDVAILDTQANTGFQGTAATTGTFTVSPGSNRAMLVAFHHAGPTTVTSCTYGNQAMTFRGSVTSSNGFPAKITVYSIGEAGIAAASDNVIRPVGSFSGGRMRALAQSFRNVDPSSPVVATANAIDSIAFDTLTPAVEAGGFVSGFVCVVNEVDNFTFSGITKEAGGEETSTGESLNYAGGRAATPSDGNASITLTPVNGTGNVTQQCAFAISLRKPGSEDPGGGDLTGQALREALFETADRQIFVSTSGSDSNDGLSLASAKRTIQAGINITGPNEVCVVEDGIYDETISVSNRSGGTNTPVWIAARNPFGVEIVGGLITSIREGSATWTLDGGGDDVYFTSASERPYIGSHNGDFLMHYVSEADLRASSITAFSAIAGANRTISKPDYGFAYDSGQDRIYIRLKDRSNPNGQRIDLTDGFSQTIVDFNNCDNLIFDGFIVRGAGNTAAINFDSNSANPIIRNCQITHSRHGAQAQSNMRIEDCEYTHEGLGNWARDLYALDGTGDHGVFVLFKGYYNAALVPSDSGGGSGNSLLEGSVETNRTGSPPSNYRLQRCLIGPAFDGSRIGECNNSFALDNIFLECFDDGLQNEGLSGHPASNNEIVRNKFINCFRSCSFQESTNSGDAFFHQNIILQDDPDIFLNGATLKMISTPSAMDVKVYRNTWIMRVASGNVRIWDDFSGATPDRIIDFYDNVIFLEQDLNGSHSSERPQDIDDNVVAGNSSGNVAVLLEGGGIFTGTTEASLGLDQFFVPQAGSSAIGTGQGLLAGDRAGGRNDNDCGALPFGFGDASAFPRPQTRTPNFAAPVNWPGTV